jgi:hypothetical protein
MLVNLWGKVKTYRWDFIWVYGLAPKELKDGFLPELVSFWQGIDILFIVGEILIS